MVTTPAKIEPQPTKREQRLSTLDAAIRVFLAGSEVGAVRRIILYVVVILALGAAAWTVVGAAGMIALLLLIATDSLR